jgi:hypothetical protein
MHDAIVLAGWSSYNYNIYLLPSGQQRALPSAAALHQHSLRQIGSVEEHDSPVVLITTHVTSRSQGRHWRMPRGKGATLLMYCTSPCGVETGLRYRQLVTSASQTMQRHH